MAAHRYLRLHTGGRISRPDPVRSRCRGVVPPQRTLDLSADARPDGTAFARVPVRRSAAAPNFRGADERRGIRQAIAAGDRHRPACQAFRPAAGNLYRTNTRYRDLGTAAPGNRAECGKRQEGSGSQPAMVEKFLGQKLHLRRNAGHRHGFRITQSYLLQSWMPACGGRGAYPIKFNGGIFTVDPVFTDTKIRRMPITATGAATTGGRIPG